MSTMTYDVPADGVVAHPTPPMVVSTEDGDVLWLPVEWHETPSKAKTAARDYGFEDSRWVDLRVRKEWLRCEDRYEDARPVGGWADEMFYVCQPTDEHARLFWRITDATF